MPDGVSASGSDEAIVVSHDHGAGVVPSTDGEIGHRRISDLFHVELDYSCPIEPTIGVSTFSNALKADPWLRSGSGPTRY